MNEFHLRTLMCQPTHQPNEKLYKNLDYVGEPDKNLSVGT